MKLKYEGPIERGMIFTAPDNDGVLGLRRLRMVGRLLDDRTLILEELSSRANARLGRGRRPGELTTCPELNLRVVFELEHADVATGADPG